MTRSGSLDWQHEGATWPNRAASGFVSAGGLIWHVQRAGPLDRSETAVGGTTDEGAAPPNPAPPIPAPPLSAQPSPTILLVHGTAASTHSWGGLLPLLARRFDVVAMDLPGHGFTRLKDHRVRLTLPYMARALAALASELNLKRPIGIGHSAGAAILIEAERTGHLPQTAIIGLNAALLPFAGVGRHVFPVAARLMMLNPLLPDLFAWRAGSRETVRGLIEGMGSKLEPDRLAYYQRLFQDRDHVAAALGMMAGWDLEAFARGLAHLHVPLTLIAAAQDRAVPPETAENVRERAPATRIVRLDGLGHLAHEEDPQRVAAVLVEIIRETVTATA